jgi:hypothetical protein
VKVKGKGKVRPTTGHEDPEGKKRYSSTLSLTWVRGGGGWLTPRITSGIETRYPLYRRLYGPQDPSGRVQKNLSSTGIRSQDRRPRGESLY